MNQLVDNALGGADMGEPLIADGQDGVIPAQTVSSSSLPSPTKITAPLNGGTCSVSELRLAECYHDFTGVGEQNSCERSKGDASARKDEDSATTAGTTSPTHSREELVEVMMEAAWCCRCETDMQEALSALEAIGAVKIKGGV